MLNCGLVTVTFRKFDKEKIVKISKDAGLSLLEWGGDIHVPPMNKAEIEKAVSLTSSHGLKIAAYGSYYKCRGPEEDMIAAIDTAALLGADTIRVWPGEGHTYEMTAEERRGFIDNLRKACRYAAAKKITVSTEFHPHTLTDCTESTMRMIDEVADENLRLYWQPNQHKTEEYNIDSLKKVLPYLTNVHVFTWKGDDKFPLITGEKIWRQYIDIIASDNRDHGMLLEFIHDDTEEQCYKDAEVLAGWLR